MMVTFISQCQKKALARTRRVLDAFANRIGDNTWQTVITEEGLIAVKKLLRKTATKNTAVSCHWIRSRSRSELVWIVGSRQCFNNQGIVPVNTTQKEVFMDLQNFKPKEDVAYANTEYQPLDQHLFAVGYIAYLFYKKLVNAEPNHAQAIYFSGLLHDIGKNDPNFQSYIRNLENKKIDNEDGQHIEKRGFSFEDYPRHNELSALIFHVLNNEANNKSIRKRLTHIGHVIYWHHAAPFRKNEKLFASYKGLSEIYFAKVKKMKASDFFSQAKKYLEDVDKIANIYNEKSDSLLDFLKWENIDQDFDKNYQLSYEPTPEFKWYSDAINLENLGPAIRDNAINNIMRTCVITSDRLVSKLTRSELHHSIKDKTLSEYVDNALDVISNLDNEIDMALSSGQYDPTRNKEQSEVALTLSRKEGIAILAGAAGCGKTKIALEWASLKKAKKIFWICPRVQVCQGVFTELTEQYLPDSDIQIYTGEFKFSRKWDNPTHTDDELDADIIVTTIDQILNAVTSHTKVDLLIDFLNAHVVFDEYHEYTNMPAFNLLFAELVEVKKQQNNQSTLLVSATPNPYFIEKVLGLSPKHDIVEMRSFNECLYQIEFISFDESKHDATNPLFAPQSEQTFVISNTAQTAQLSFIKNQANENSILFHSKYKRSDKKFLFNEVYESFKKDGMPRYSILRSGPIVQASLNISSKNMVSEITTPENLLQRLGRLDRFGMNKSGVNYLKLAVPITFMDKKNRGNCANFLLKQHQLSTTKLWLEHLLSNLSTDAFRLESIYELYNSFYQTHLKNKDLENELLGAISQSIKLINHKVTDPIKIPRKKDETTNIIKLSGRSLRGNNVFVQMTKCNVDNYEQPEILNEYAYSESIDDKTPIDNLTASVREIRGYDKPDKDLVINMYKKHHHIKGGKQSYNDDALIKEARSSDFPIYLSYAPNDLIEGIGNSKQHQHAIFYCVCNKQPIGALKLNSLINFEDDSDE